MKKNVPKKSYEILLIEPDCLSKPEHIGAGNEGEALEVAGKEAT